MDHQSTHRRRGSGATYKAKWERLLRERGLLHVQSEVGLGHEGLSERARKVSEQADAIYGSCLKAHQAMLVTSERIAEVNDLSPLQFVCDVGRDIEADDIVGIILNSAYLIDYLSDKLGLLAAAYDSATVVPRTSRIGLRRLGVATADLDRALEKMGAKHSTKIREDRPIPMSPIAEGIEVRRRVEAIEPGVQRPSRRKSVSSVSSDSSSIPRPTRRRGGSKRREAVVVDKSNRDEAGPSTLLSADTSPKPEEESQSGQIVENDSGNESSSGNVETTQTLTAPPAIHRRGRTVDRKQKGKAVETGMTERREPSTPPVIVRDSERERRVREGRSAIDGIDFVILKKQLMDTRLLTLKRREGVDVDSLVEDVVADESRRGRSVSVVTRIRRRLNLE